MNECCGKSGLTMGILCGVCGNPPTKSVDSIFVYTITSIYTAKPDADLKTTPWRELEQRSRLVGFYKTLEKAKLCVEEDWPHFDEGGYYNYIVIEGLWEGCYPGLGDNEWWYRHDWEARKWVPCEKPKCFQGTCNFYG